MRLSIIIPVFNEEKTIIESLKRVIKTKLASEIIVVDDASTDTTLSKLKKFVSQSPDNIIILSHIKNKGKGAAVKTAITKITGDYVIIHDADLEYDPIDIQKLIKPVKEGKATVVYGSRFSGEHRDMLFWNWLANHLLNLLINILYNTTVSDMETCYKLIPADIIKSIKLSANRFDFEPEITSKILKKGIRIYEVPISYAGREYSQGKKINWKDGIQAFFAIIKYRLTG